MFDKLEKIATAVSGLKTAGELMSDILKLGDAAAIQAKVAELNGVIIAAQQSALAANADQLALLKKVSDLEAQLMKFETWGAEKERYELKRHEPGVWVRSLKPAMQNGEPAHEICADCYEQGHKRHLQAGEANNGLTRLTCNGCGSELRIGHFIRPDQGRPPRYGR